MILMIDNYDSFTYNLVHYLMRLGLEVSVARNDKINPEQIAGLKPAFIVLSPGPGTPDGAGRCLEIVEHFKSTIPILGICLGHQTIGQTFGAKIVQAKEPVHGKVHPIRHTGEAIFCGLNNPFKVTRYHSLVIDRETLPASLEITAESLDGEIMGIRHREYPLQGVQFHPEAILTENGMELLKNFLVFAQTFRR